MERLTEWKDNRNMLAKPKFSGDFGSTNILCRLAEYEDAEEQGLLLRLPCKVGDSIYSVVEDGLTILELKFSLDFYARRKNDIGKTVFLTKSEAEQKLKEMESD